MQLPETNNTLIDPFTLFSKTWTQYQALFAPLFATAFLGIFAASFISIFNTEDQDSYFIGQLIFLASIIPSTISEAAVIMLVSMKRDLESTSIARAYSLVFPLIHRLLIPSILLSFFMVTSFPIIALIYALNVYLAMLAGTLFCIVLARTSLYVPVILLEQSSRPWSMSFILSPIIRSNDLVKGKTLRTLGLLAPVVLGAGILTVIVPAVMGVGGPDGNKVALILTVSIVSALIQPYIIILTLFIYENYAQVEAQKEIDELSINPDV